jgi:hypothetical protein
VVAEDDLAFVQPGSGRKKHPEHHDMSAADHRRQDDEAGSCVRITGGCKNKLAVKSTASAFLALAQIARFTSFEWFGKMEL